MANCRNWVIAKIAPNSEKNARLTDSEPMLKRGLRNRLRSSIGAAVRSSQATNAAASASVPPNAPRMTGSSQPRSGASMTA